MNTSITINSSNIARRFKSAAHSYDAHAAVHKEIAQDLIAHLTHSDPKTVLDVGAGTGILSQKVAEKFPNALICAQDLCEELLQVNQATLPNLETRVGDFCHIDLLAHYDIIVSSAALHWMEDPKLAYEKIRAALNTEGQMALAIMTANTFPELAEARKHVSDKASRTKLNEATFWTQLYPEFQSELKTYRTHFASAENFLRVLHNMGVTASNNMALPLTRQELKRLCAYYNNHFTSGDEVYATYEVIHLWLK